VFPFNKLKLNSELNQLYVPLTKNKKTDEMLNSVIERGVADAPQNQEVQGGHLY
jgi:hypothetical protein